MAYYAILVLYLSLYFRAKEA